LQNMIPPLYEMTVEMLYHSTATWNDGWMLHCLYHYFKWRYAIVFPLSVSVVLPLLFQTSVGQSVLKKHNFFMNSEGDKFCTKIVVFVEIYNFVVQIHFIEHHLHTQMISILSRSDNAGGRHQPS
jgi:hypothetical protein